MNVRELITELMEDPGVNLNTQVHVVMDGFANVAGFIDVERGRVYIYENPRTPEQSDARASPD